MNRKKRDSRLNYLEARDSLRLNTRIRIEKYNPSKIYISRTRVLINCEEHGISECMLETTLCASGGCKICALSLATSNTINSKIAKSKIKLEKCIAEIFNGQIEIRSAFGGMSKPLTLFCHKHNEEFTVDHAGSMRYKAGCNACCKERAHLTAVAVHGLNPDTYRKRVKERTRGRIEVLEDYIGYSKRSGADKIRHLCKIHGEFRTYPDRVLSTKHFGCAECVSAARRFQRRSITPKQFKQKLREVHGNDVIPIGEYVNKTTRMEFKCVHDGCKWTTTPDSALSGHGCPECARHINIGAIGRAKDYMLGDTAVRVRGYEPQALDLLMRKYEPSELRVGREVPTIQYTHNNKKRTYYPDIFIPEENRIVEVKSTYFFGFTDEALFATLKSKRAGVLRAGYKFNVLVMGRSGRKIKIPKHWYSMTHDQFKQVSRGSTA